MSYSSGIMEIETAGNESIVHIRSWEFPSESALEECWRELDAFLDSHVCEVLSFDLEGVAIIPSTMLGLMVTIGQRDLRIRILNPSEHVLAVLEVTKLSTKFEVKATSRSG